MSAPIAIYIHIPFCVKHCAYCDFNTYVEKSGNSVVQRTVDAICTEIRDFSQQVQHRSIETIFFGGGTPTFLSSVQLTSILKSITDNYSVTLNAEISSEANPGSSDAIKFEGMLEAGFNRLSVGVQSFNDNVLVALDRFHSSQEAEIALKTARSAGFQNLNLDLMFGLPRQTMEIWNDSLRRACDLDIEHLSLYALTLEPGTRFERQHVGGKLVLPDEDTELAMYETCIQLLQTNGYEHYEVSNFARPGFRCRHNQVYWRNEEYLGFGPGAVSYWNGNRFKKERIPVRYCNKVENSLDLTVESETLDAAGSLGETMMLGLRLRDGLNTTVVSERFGVDPLTQFDGPISRLRKLGLLEQNASVLRLTHEGLLIANTVLAEFLPEVSADPSQIDKQ